MNIKERAKEAKEKIGTGIESRLEKVEHFINERGLGHNQLSRAESYLSRAKKTQRNVNLAIVAGCAITVAGIAVWAIASNTDHDDA